MQCRVTLPELLDSIQALSVAVESAETAHQAFKDAEENASALLETSELKCNILQLLLNRRRKNGEGGSVLLEQQECLRTLKELMEACKARLDAVACLDNAGV